MPTDRPPLARLLWGNRGLDRARLDEMAEAERRAVIDDIRALAARAHCAGLPLAAFLLDMAAQADGEV
jgi:hypothetical protein